MVHDMTVGSVRGHVLRMSLFVLAVMAMQTLYALIDMYWVGHLGAQAVAAVAVSANLSFVALAVTQMLSVGCVALVSQAAGRKDYEAVQRLFNQAQSLSLIAGALFLVAGYATMETYAEHFAGDAESAALAVQFLVYFLPALALQFAMIALVSALRGIGHMKPGLVAQTGSVIVNMVLAPCLVFGWLGAPTMGVAGAALASLVSTAAAVIGLFVYLLRGQTVLRTRASILRPDFQVWGKMLGIGLPAGSEFLLITLNMAVVYYTVRQFGSSAQAGVGIGSRIQQASLMPAVAIGFAVAAVVGQNFGAAAFQRVRESFRESARLTTALMGALTIVSLLSSSALMRPFTKDPEVIEIGADFVWMIALNYMAQGFVFVIAGVFQGVGNTWPALFASAVRSVVFAFPVLWLSRQHGFSIHKIWYWSIASTTLQLALSLFLLRRELDARVPGLGATAEAQANGALE